MKNYTEHHTAYARGYVSRKDKRTAAEKFAAGCREEYHGIYGDGYIVRTPAYNTTNYHFVTYFIEG